MKQIKLGPGNYIDEVLMGRLVLGGRSDGPRRSCGAI